jgi:hypothetical protein
MKKQKMFRYLGKNGIITSEIELINTEFLPMLRITADSGKILTNGEKQVYSTIIFPEDLEEWTEINAPKPID